MPAVLHDPIIKGVGKYATATCRCGWYASGSRNSLNALSSQHRKEHKGKKVQVSHTKKSPLALVNGESQAIQRIKNRRNTA